MRNKRTKSAVPQTRRPVRPFVVVSEETAGLPPGSPIYIGDKAATRATISLYSYNQSAWSMECPGSAHQAIDLLDPGRVNWININGLSGGAMESICSHLGVHPLVIEDILNTEHRPKIEVFADYVFLIVKMLTYTDDHSIDYEQVSFVLKGSTLVTIQERPGDCFKVVRDRIVSGGGRLRQKGADYLAYALLDLIVDNYFIILEDIGDRLEGFEASAMAGDAPRDFMVGLQAIKAELLHIRRTIWPVRDMVGTLMRLDTELLGVELTPYLRDLYENAVQSLDALESYREYTAGLVEIHLSSVNNRMGEVMKVLTIISTLFIPLTFIAGVYGMNFEHMPEIRQAWGYPAILGFMACVAIGELIYFRHKKWI